MITYTPKHFRIEELVPQALHKALGDRAWLLMDARILWTLDMVREHFGSPVTVNTAYKGGQFDQRGFRSDSTTGAVYSQHRYGRAVDYDVAGKTAEEVRKELLKKQADDIFRFITVIESDVTWVHMDCRNVPRINGNILLVKP